jgi:hypothetical protein
MAAPGFGRSGHWAGRGLLNADHGVGGRRMRAEAVIGLGDQAQQVRRRTSHTVIPSRTAAVQRAPRRRVVLVNNTSAAITSVGRKPTKMLRAANSPPLPHSYSRAPATPSS